MFHEVARKKQALSIGECHALLRTELRGVLAVQGDGGYPYALPINYYYDEEENRIYFHSGKTGHKMDALKRCDKVSLCVYDKGMRREGHWSLDFKSVIVFGRMRVANEVSDALMEKFSRRFTDDTEYIRGEIESFRASTAILYLEIEHMTGKRVNEA